MHLLIWGLALVLLALWSLFGWAGHAVLTVDTATLAGAAALASLLWRWLRPRAARPVAP
ncbi:hypothetical protein [Azohydromonas sediminis]|uniref:hypothetical protein n=1 Tax=Azohydromonas sediminis TaxID=2259674 RepID=UPI0013C357BB|nr:hypothetical protein [Azohydromonas sediminis]